MKKVLFSVLIIPAIFIMLSACKKEEHYPPSINLKIGSEYTADQSVMMVGHRLTFGIQARGNGANITNFTIKKVLDDQTVITMMDTGMNAVNLDLNKIFYQNVEPRATWVFTVMDRNRLSSQVSLVIYKDSNSTFGGIYEFPRITMGYQMNTTFGHFLSLPSGKVYFADSAAMFQNTIDVLTYFIMDGTPSPVLSSPGEMDNYGTEAKEFYPEIIGWTSRNYTLWDISVDDNPVPVSAYDDAHNDSLLIVSYHDVWGKKKFKWATSGRVIPFLTGSGKFGLIKVIEADVADTGKIVFSLKIQQ